MEDAITKADIRIAVVLFFSGRLESFREWLIDEVSCEEESGRLLEWLEDHDLTSTFGAIHFTLVETRMLERVLEAMTSDEELMKTARENRVRTFKLGLEWNDTEQLDTNRDFVVALRRRFNRRFKSFQVYVIQNFAEEDEKMAIAIFSTKNFSQFVSVVSDFGRLEVFKVWLENHRVWHPSTATFAAVMLNEMGDA